MTVKCSLQEAQISAIVTTSVSSVVFIISAVFYRLGLVVTLNSPLRKLSSPWQKKIFISENLAGVRKIVYQDTVNTVHDCERLIEIRRQGKLNCR